MNPSMTSEPPLGAEISVHAEPAPNPTRLPNPWAGPRPKSVEQPNLVVKLRSFTDFKLECHNGKSYPYELPEEAAHQVPFYELLGYGLPPSDVLGNPGDIYIDLTPPCRVYVRTMETWAWWDWSNSSWLGSIPSHIPRHPILSNRYLAQNQQSLRLSWLSKVTLRKTHYSGVEKYIVEEYQKLCRPYEKDQERMETERKRRASITEGVSAPSSSKRGRSPPSDRSDSSSKTLDFDERPWKKAKPNLDLKDTKEASPTLGIAEIADTESDVDYVVAGSDSASRCVSPSPGGAENLDEEDENDELETWNANSSDCESPLETKELPNEQSPTRGDETPSADLPNSPKLQMYDENEDADIENGQCEGETSSECPSLPILDFGCPDDEDMVMKTLDSEPTPNQIENHQAPGTTDPPDALTSRTLALLASVKDLNDARLVAEKKNKVMNAQINNFAEQVDEYKARNSALENELKKLTTENEKLVSELEGQRAAHEKLKIVLSENEDYKLNCEHLVSVNATYKELYQNTVAKRKRDEQKITELSKRCADADAARAASEKALADVKQTLRKIVA